jgi:3-hydroxy-9,10-secoandrosta-1,3,5(10)-triene-9,17-dione monooxygenase reductase component
MTVAPRLLRSAFGTYATGVTIITTLDLQGENAGLTANSFSSVSLEPPLLLWSLARNANSFAAFMACEGFAVHVLSADQQSLSDRFAKKDDNKFAGLDVGRGLYGVPLIDGCAARFQCRTYARHDAGDHVIFLGQVEEFDHTDLRPLLYHGGRYSRLAPAAEG